LRARTDQSADDEPAGHTATEGPTLGAETTESVHTGARCTPDAPVRAFAVVAVNVEITLNRFLDYDPQGRMYVLQDDLPRVRQEEAQNRAARAGQAEPEGQHRPAGRRDPTAHRARQPGRLRLH